MKADALDDNTELTQVDTSASAVGELTTDRTAEAIEYLKNTRLGKKYPKSMLKGLKIKERDTKKKISTSDRKAKRKSQKQARKVNR
jgi:hypothetical protein